MFEAAYDPKATRTPSFATAQAPAQAQEQAPAQAPAEAFPLTYPQASIWYTEMLNPGTGICNVAATMRIEDELDRDWVEQAVNCMLRRNEGFHLRVHEVEGRPEQYVAPFHPYALPVIDFRDQSIEKYYEWETQQTRLPCDVVDADLYAFALVRIPPNASGFYVRCHHLISDAWSMVQIANEIVEYYYLQKAGLPLPEEPNPAYSAFAAAEQEYFTSARCEADRSFWRERYAVPPEPTSLKARPTGRIGYAARRKTFLLPEKLVRKIKAHCSENKTSVFALFYAALGIYANRVQGAEEVVFGTPVLNRINIREKKTIGMFISTVPLRARVDGEASFQDFARRVDSEWFSVLKHQKYPYDLLLKDVREQRKDLDRLFDIAVSYQNAKMVKEGEGSREESRWHFNGQQVESLYLHINDREDDGRLVVNYDYRTDLFYAKEIDFLHEHLIQLLWHALDNPARKISEIHMLGEKEKQKVLETFNDTDAGYPRTATVGSLFAEQVRLRPDAPALVHGTRTLTYRELDAKANRLANRLRASGVGPETLVALLLPRTPELVVGILGVVKAGGAYLPLDPEYPAERISFMLEDSRTRHLVSCVEFLEGFPFDGDRIDLFALLDEPAVSVAASIASATPGADPDSAPPDLNGPDDLLYVIYTSGTTGRPKGAQVVHRNVVRLLFNDRFAFDFGPDDRWSLFHSYSFDFSVWEMYGALLYGGTLVVVPRDIARDTGRFLNLLVRERITVLNQTPAAFYNLVDAIVREGAPPLALRTVVFGGDALKPALLKPFRSRYPKTKLVNMYGITETTVHVTYLELTDADLERGVSNVGRPIPTTRTYILDRKLNPQPIGIPGELCVGGDGVGRGYLNNQDLTATKFVPDPFVPGGFLYRSGDLARYFPQGDIEYLGRIDTQVKIRGHRIELGEIESGLLRFDRISKAAVVALETPEGGRRLCAYLVPTAAFETGELRTFLARFLPDYMVPTLFVRLDDIPLNNNGKIDRARLPVPEADEADTEVFVAPRTELESWIAGVWCDALKIQRIGVDDDFFQSGGDSLNAVVAISQLNGRASFGDLYRNPTVARLAEAIARKETEGINDQLLLKLSGTESLGGTEHTNIVCFPYGGGNAGIYKDLADAVARRSSTTSVYAVDLPGRLAVDPDAPSLEPRLDSLTDSGLVCESASAEPLRGAPLPGSSRIPASALRDNEDLASQLADEIRSFVAGEVVVYGHCVGNALALETVRRLRSLGVPVRAFYAGAILPPADPKRIRRGHDPWRHVPDSGILAVLGRLGLPHCELGSKPLKALLRAFRFDVRAYYRFFRERGDDKPLDVPVHSIFGGADPFTFGHRTRHRRWSRYAETFTPVVLDGASHYFMKTHPEQLAGILMDEMANDPPAVA